MSDCPYTGKTLLEKKELPLPSFLPLWKKSGSWKTKDEFLDKPVHAVSQTEEMSEATASPEDNQPFTPDTQSDQRRFTMRLFSFV